MTRKAPQSFRQAIYATLRLSHQCLLHIALTADFKSRHHYLANHCSQFADQSPLAG